MKYTFYPGDLVLWKRSDVTTHVTNVKVVQCLDKNGFVVVTGISGRKFDAISGKEVKARPSYITKLSLEEAVDLLISKGNVSCPREQLLEALKEKSLRQFKKEEDGL